MSFDAQRWAYDLDGLSAAGKSVLTALAFMANTDGKCWPSQARLARMTALGERTVRRELRALEEAGLLTRARRTNARGRSTDFYRLAVPATLAGTPSSTGHTGRSVPATVAREQSIEQSDLKDLYTVTADAATPTKTDRHRLLGAIQTIATLVAQHVHNEDPHRGEAEVESALDDLYALGADIYGEDPFEYGINLRGWTITAREQDRYAAGTWLNKYLAWHRNEA